MFFLDIVDPTFSYFAPVLLVIICALIAILVAALPFLSHALFKFIKAKTGIVVSESQQKQFDDIITSVVLQVEQKARQLLKLGKTAPDGAKKLEEACDKVEKRLKDVGLYDELKDRVVDEIEAAVANMNGPLTTAEKDEIKASIPSETEADDEKPKKIGEK